jgi:hypothetical protein
VRSPRCSRARRPRSRRSVIAAQGRTSPAGASPVPVRAWPQRSSAACCGPAGPPMPRPRERSRSPCRSWPTNG